MTTRYLVARLGSAGTASREIDAEYYWSLVRAKHHVRQILFAEENLELLLENYIDFERELLEIGLEYQVYRSIEWEDGQVMLRRTNRQLANLLSAGRLYEEHIKEIVSGLGWVEGYKKNRFLKNRKAFEKGSLGTKIVRLVRNHIQHHQLPIDKIGAGSNDREGGDSGEQEFRVIPLIGVARLSNNPRFDPGVLREMEKIGDRIPIAPLIRQYIEDIGDVHDQFRTHTHAAGERARSEIEGLLNKGEEWFNNIGPGLVLIREGDDSKPESDGEIFYAMLNYWNKLVMKNLDIIGLAHGYVSGRCSLSDSERD